MGNVIHTGNLGRSRHGKCTVAGYPCPRRVTSLLQGGAFISAQLRLLGFAAILNELNTPLNMSAFFTALAEQPKLLFLHEASLAGLLQGRISYLRCNFPHPTAVGAFMARSL